MTERTAEEIAAEQAIENGECGAQLEIKDADLRESLVRNVASGMKRHADQQTAALRERLADLVKGMPVFKDAPEGPDDEWGVRQESIRVTVGAVRRARAALAAERGEG